VLVALYAGSNPQFALPLTRSFLGYIKGSGFTATECLLRGNHGTGKQTGVRPKLHGDGRLGDNRSEVFCLVRILSKER